MCQQSAPGLCWEIKHFRRNSALVLFQFYFSFISILFHNHATAAKYLFCLCIFQSEQTEDAEEGLDTPSGRAAQPSSSSSLRRSPVGRLDVVELGLYDPVDAFWNRHVDLTSLSRSEQDMLERLNNSAATNADAVTYEDLMDFALDGPTLRSGKLTRRLCYI